MNAPTSSLTVLVCSCDAYSDLWKPFFTLFFRHWPGCPWPVALMSNEKRFGHGRVETIAVGDRGSWSAELREVLRHLPSSHVLLMLDDFFLRRDVRPALVESCFADLVSRDGHMLRLVSRPGPDRSLADSDLVGEVAVGAPYRVSAQSAIWRKATLDSLLVDGESIWQFEVLGSRRADAIDGFYAVRRDVMPYGHHVVERGKWFRQEARRFGRMDIGCDFSRRSALSRPEQLAWWVRKAGSAAYGSVPWQWRRSLRWLKP